MQPMPMSPPHWNFIDELREYSRPQVSWQAVCSAKSPDLQIAFPDPQGVLDTAYAALRRFMGDTGINEYRVEIAKTAFAESERYELKLGADSCCLTAGDTEGVRRGIYFLIDLWKGAESPKLAPHTYRRSSWAKTRISRCCFGPINRPPLNRDELMDDIDYYPDAYLDKLAASGINALWLSISFANLCRTRFTPKHGMNAERRMRKLRATVAQCGRYGIKVYLFANEPVSWTAESEVPRNFPKLGGAKIAGQTCFCPSSEEGAEYLYDSMRQIFAGVKNLGGLINISLGEAVTTCLSSVNLSDPAPVACERCRNLPRWQILFHALDAMRRGMHSAAPGAELISWLYLPTPDDLPEWVYDIPRHAPKGVSMQFNCESGVNLEQLGKLRRGGDYWLSVASPSNNFKSLAAAAVENGVPIFAKIQVGCSHEVASVPMVPVPSLLYRKYKEMRQLKVRGVMQGWYFGNYPGLMNTAAGELAFADFKESEQEFLCRLAQRGWGRAATDVVQAWTLLADGYACYPLSNMFQYFGPVADGVVWPLYLYPVNRGLLPTWLLSMQPGGDNICECLENHSLAEATMLMEKLSRQWDSGAAIFSKLRDEFKGNQERLRDIGVIEALNCQFKSAVNILKFYQFRRTLFDAQNPVVLDAMRTIVEAEIANGEKLLILAEADPRLGFHPEAEGYKYFPDKIRWRIGLLQALLADDFKRARQEVDRHSLALPRERFVYRVGVDGDVPCRSFRWYAQRDVGQLHFHLELDGLFQPLDEVYLGIDDGGMSFPWLFHAASTGVVYVLVRQATCRISQQSQGWQLDLSIPLTDLPLTGALRLNIVRLAGNYDARHSWPPDDLLSPARLNLIFYEPANMGRLSLTCETTMSATKQDSYHG